MEWPDLDLQLSVDSIVQGRRETVPPRGWREGLASRLAAFRRSNTASSGSARRTRAS